VKGPLLKKSNDKRKVLLAAESVKADAQKNFELRYRRLFETAQDGILILDARTGQIDDVNPFLISMLGYTRREFLGRKLWEIGAFKDVVASKAKFLELQRKGFVRYEDLPLQTKQGRTMEVEFVSNSYVVGDVRVIQCNIRDITERRKAESVVLFEKGRLKKYLDLVGVIVVALGRDGKVIMINKKGCDILKCGARGIIGKNWFGTFIPRRDRRAVRDVFEKIKAGKMKGAEHFENSVLTPSGKERIIAWHNINVNDKGKFVYSISSGEDVTEQREKERALAESEGRFRKIFEEGSIGISLVGLDGKFLRANAALCNIVGYSEKELKRKTFGDITHPEEAARDMGMRALLLKREIPFYQVEKRYIAKGGSIRWVSIHVSIIYGQEGEPRYFLTLTEDISKRREAEKRLLASYHMASILSASGSMAETWPSILRTICTDLGWAWGEIWSTDEYGTQLTLAERWHGHPGGYPEFDKATSEMVFRPGYGLPGNVMKSGEPAWVEDIAKERSFIRTDAAIAAGFKSACAFPLIIGNEVVGVMVLFSDTRRSPDKELLQSLKLIGYQIGQFIKHKTAEQSLKESEARFHNVFDHGPIGMLLSGPDYRFIQANPAACRIFRYSESELRKMTFKDITHPEDLSKDIAQVGRLGRGEIQLYRTEKRYVQKGEGVVWGSINVSSINDSAGRLKYYLALVEDITEQKRNQEELIQEKEKVMALSASRDRFIADMTHELKTPLSVIMLHLDLMRRADLKHTADEVSQSYNLMWRNALRLSRSIDQIMELTNMESILLRPRRFSVSQSIRDVIEEYTPLAKLKGLEIDSQGEDIEANCDPHVFAMAFSNVISNAVKFTEKGRVSIRWGMEAGEVVVTVVDTGVGIHREDQPKVFDKFFKANPDAPGSGIGLSLSVELLNKIGGRITMSSKPGRGSVFRLIIPKEMRK
jgi:PAS domain S-box-containing protein